MSGYLRRLGVYSKFGREAALHQHRNHNNNKYIASVIKRCYSYEGDGKTTVTILNSEEGAPLMIDAYSTMGFRLNNGFQVVGPMAIFPKSVLSWAVRDIHDISFESLSLFFTLEPKLDILLIGCGDQGKSISRENYVNIQKLNKKGTSIEILSSDNACTTFNFLNNEKRSVAAAIIPPVNVNFIDEDIWKTQARKKVLYKDTYEEKIDKFYPSTSTPKKSF